MEHIWIVSFILLILGEVFLVSCEETISAWSECSNNKGHQDQNCYGSQNRTITTITYTFFGQTVSVETETKQCLLTLEKTDGGYTPWGAWDDCSNKCGQETIRTRSCNNPTPCNGGKDCSEFGRDYLTKICRPAIGEWGDWEPWESCERSPESSSLYGTGTRKRKRYCDDPPPVCGGDFCVGTNNETGNCRVIPPCLTYQMFSEKFLREDNPLVIYTSSQVDVYLLTKNICSTKVIVSTYYELYKMNSSATEMDETMIGTRTWNVRFMFDPGKYDLGLYRLYAWIGYTKDGINHWMEESMYVKIEHPPPHAFIKGGVGRTVGQGHVNFDARSVSYSLTKGPGDPSGLTFQWRCLGFLTKGIYKLLQFNIDSKLVFSDIPEITKKWYETKFLKYIENKVSFIKGSSLSNLVNTLKSSEASCETAHDIYVKMELNKYRKQKVSDDTTEPIAELTTTVETSTEPCYTSITECLDVVQCVNNTESNSLECNNVTRCSDNLKACTTTPKTTTESLTYDLIPLTKFYKITYMYEMESLPPLLHSEKHILPLPENNTLIKNEFDEFIQSLNDAQSISFPDDTLEFFELLSGSSLTLNSLYQLNGLTGIPESANETFFIALNTWLQTAKVSREFAYKLVDLFKNFQSVGVYISSALELVDILGMNDFLRLSVDESGECLLNQLYDLFEGFKMIDSFDWNDMKLKEKFYLDWMEEELLSSSACKGFSSDNSGRANLIVSANDATLGLGFLVYLRVEFDGSVSYFIQHAQTVTGEPLDIEIECRLNCMKKTALTSIMSLKSSCPTCSAHEQRNARFWWDVKHFDLFTRTVAVNDQWQSWMLSELNTQRFVMKANVLNANSGYILEAFVEVNGRKGWAVLTIGTNILPYDGSCQLRDARWGEKKITTYGWKDEGFRSSIDKSLDWKEQLNYRIMQITSDGKETLLYYGSEEQNYIKLKPGVVENNYEVMVKIQIYDIFIDYAECNIAVGQIYPDYQTDDKTSVSNFLDDAGDSIDYYWNVRNFKQVGMNAEVAGTPVQNMNISFTILDTDPMDWLNLGVVSNSDGSNTTQTFDELWESYLNPDFGDVATQNVIKEKLTNFSGLLTNVSDLVSGASTVNLEQIATSIGSIVGNKYFTEYKSAENAFTAARMLVDKLELLAFSETYPKFEDYIQTCEGVLRILNNALEALLPTTYADLPSDLDMYSIMNDISSREALSTDSGADLTTIEKSFIAQQIAMKNELDKSYKDDIVRNKVPTLLEDIRRLGHILSMLNFRKQMSVFVQNGYIISTENKKDISELLQKGYQTNGVNINFTASPTAPTGEHNVQVTLYDHTPFCWDRESNFITSKTVSVNIRKNNLTDTGIPSTLSIPSPSTTAVPQTIRLAIPIDDEPTSQLILYKFFWKTPSDTAIFEIRNALTGMNHTVYLRQKLPPDPSENVYDQVFQIGPLDWEQDKIKVVIAGDLYSKPTNVYIVVLVQQGNYTSIINRRRRSIPTTTYIDYEITASTTGCRVWDDTTQTWDKTSCQVSSSSTFSETICVCSNPPGNNFATTFYVPPNTIDFGTVFQKFNLKDNAAVLATIISLIVLYLMICIWAFRQDRKDIERWSLSYLVDNVSYDEYLYVLTVFTGLNRHAGTTSKVFFMIIDGKNRRNDNLKIRCLDDHKHQGFGVGSVRRFVMSVPAKIKDPSVIKIWHDNSGEGNSASWYLDKIVLEDVQTGDRYMFVCDRWLSLDDDDGCIDCAIPICNQSDTHKFSFLFNEKSKQNTTDGHLWLSVAIRPEDSNFSRMERLACCLALLFLTMISNAMFYRQDTGGTVRLGPISFSLTGIYISIVSALIVAPPIFFISFLFRKSRKRIRRHREKKNESHLPIRIKKENIKDEKDDITNNSDFPLPFWCRYIAWTVITVTVLLSGFFLILYSMEWGKSKAEAWLACFFMSFFESMFIVDPLKIILMSVILSWIVKSYNVDTIKYDKDKLLRETKRQASKPSSYLLNLYKRQVAPVKPSKVEKMKKRRKFKLRVQKTFIEFLLYTSFLTVLYLVSYSNRDSRWYNLKNHIDQHIITPTLVSAGASTIKFNQVHSTSHLYTWLNQTLLPFMFPRFKINDDRMKAYDRLYVEDQINFRVGPMRLRQVRSNSENCVGYRFDNLTCYDSYSILNEDNLQYCIGWNIPPCTIGQNVSYLTSTAWNYVPSIDIWGFPVSGFHTMYNGGGFISELMVNFDVSRKMLNELYENVWIDRKTRAVFIEFTLYNPDNNVFVYTSFLCEFAVTGGALTSYDIQLFRPYQHVGSLGLIVFICELVVFVGIMIFSIRKMIYVNYHGKRILKDFWNILDLVIVILFHICSVMYIGRWIMINTAMAKFEEDKNKFVNFSHISYWDELFNIFLSFTIFFTTLRIMKVLSYNERINQLSKVLTYVSRELCGCFVMFLIVYLAFTMYGYLVFGRELDTYRNLMVSSTTLVNAIIGKNSINDLFSIEPVLGRIYYFCFVLFLLWILMTMLNASLNFGITAIRSKPVPSFYGITNIVSDIWKSSVGLIFQGVNNTQTKHVNAKPLIMRKDEIIHDNDVIKPVWSTKLRKRPRPRRIYINQ